MKVGIAAMGTLAAGSMLSACSSGNEDAEQVDATNAGDQQIQDVTTTSNPDGAGKILVAYYSAQHERGAFCKWLIEAAG